MINSSSLNQQEKSASCPSADLVKSGVTPSDIYNFYMGNPSICWEILKFIRAREVGFICTDENKEIEKKLTQRSISIGNYGFLISALNYRYEKLKNRKFHFFASIEYVKKVDEKGVRIDLSKDWKVWGFDIVFDIDSEGKTLKERFNKSYLRTKKLVNVLLKENVKFRIQFSGSKGFHIFLLWDNFKDNIKPEDYGNVNREIAAKYAKKAKIKYDLATLSKAHNLIRVPFSIHPKTGLLCVPLTLEEFKKFKPEMAKPELWAKKNCRDYLEMTIIRGNYGK